MVDSKLPTRLFGLEEELNDGKINHCFQFKMIDIIQKALRPEELARLKQSSFGMLLNLPSMCKWGAGFTHYLLRKQLVTNKKYEVWFLFGGKPWRFSLREFGMVTGLCCGKLPKPVEPVEACSYWDTLFIPGSSPNVHWIAAKLSSGAVQDPELRIQYACLLLAHAILCPTSHTTPISRDYVELVRDVDAFLAYPWGRVSFEKTLESIKSKDVDLLTQQTVAITGFPYALQLVALKAIPEITYSAIRGLRLKLVSDIEKSNPKVVPLIEGGFPIEEEDLCWSDEEKDEKVDYLLELVAKKHCFSEDEWDVQSSGKTMKKRAAEESWVGKGKRSKRVKVRDVEARSLEWTQEVEARSLESTQEVEACVDGNDEEAQSAQLCEQGQKESNRQQTSNLEAKVAVMVAQEVESRMKIAARDMEAKIAHEVESKVRIAINDWKAEHVCVCDCGNRNQELENQIDAEHAESSIGVCPTDNSNQDAEHVESSIGVCPTDNSNQAILTNDGRKGVSEELAFIHEAQTKLQASDYEHLLERLYLYSKKRINRAMLDSDVGDVIGVYPELMQAFKDFLVDCEKYEGLLFDIVTNRAQRLHGEI